MDRQFKSRYRKLNIRRKTKQSKNKLHNYSSTAGANEIYNKDAGSYKIDRFLNDLNKYGRTSTPDEIDNDFHDDGTDERFIGDKARKKKKILPVKEKLPLKEKFGCNGNKREGLFLRGIMTKDFNKGLMPPSFSARLNEDLQKMIKLASGKNYDTVKNSEKCRKYPRAEEDIWNRITSFNYKHHSSISDQEDSINNERDQMMSNENGVEFSQLPMIPKKVEAEVQVSGPSQANSHVIDSRIREDLYLKFTHFVTRSLFNSGIDIPDVRYRTDCLKKSLAKIYQDGVNENNLQRDISTEQNYDTLSFLHEESDNTELSLATPLDHKRKCHPCPSTSKSEDGPLREKNTVANDSQLSDDVIIRKHKKKIYTSGTEYLKAVYGSRDKRNASRSHRSETNSIFSPIQKHLSHITPEETYNLQHRQNCSSFSPEKNYDDDNYHNSYQIHNRCISSNYSTDCNKSNRCYGISEPFTGRCFPTHNKTKYSWNDKQYSPCYLGMSIKQECDALQETHRSPEYISLLPDCHRYSTCNAQNFIDSQPSEKVPFDDSQDYLHSHQSILSLPKHLPPRKSPEIQYLPRRMF